MGLKDYDAAIADFDKAIRLIRTNYPAAYLLRGQSFAAKGREFESQAAADNGERLPDVGCAHWAVDDTHTPPPPCRGIGGVSCSYHIFETGIYFLQSRARAEEKAAP